jgi:hypothetical protein
MTIETWGMMAKSQIDPTKIEERMTEMITEHNEDPEAHLGAGKSLETHKSNEVLDHPQSSVVADKVSTGQNLINTFFETVAGWTIYADYSLNFLSYLLLRTTTTVDNIASAYFEEFPTMTVNDFDKDLMLQVTFNGDASNYGDLYFALGIADDMENYVGVGFLVTNLSLIGRYNDGDTLSTVALATLTAGRTYTIRAFINSASSNVEFWLDGILIDIIPYSREYFSDETLGFRASVQKKRGSFSAGLVLNQLTIARNL